MLVTEFGIVILVKLLQPWNAPPPMLVNLLPSSNVTVVRLLQS